MRFLPIVKKINVAVPSGGPNFIVPDRVGRRSAVGIGAPGVDRVGRKSEVIAGPTLRDSVGRSVNLSTTLSLVPSERVGRRSKLTMDLVITPPNRSGTPDADDWGDAYTDAALGQRDNNFGAVDQILMQNTLGEKRSFIEINLTCIAAGFQATGNAHTFTVTLGGNGGGLKAVEVTLAFGASATRPFTESTITQRNQPATPSLFTKTMTVAAGAAVLPCTVTLTDAEMQQLINKWVLIVLTVPALTTSSINLRTREFATASQRAILTTKVTI